MTAPKTSVVLLGPALGAISGVSTHLNQLLSSSLNDEFVFSHFQVGREGRMESGIARICRFIISPVSLAGHLLRTRPDIVHLNTSINRKAFWRDLAYLLVARALRRKTVYQVHGGKLPEDFARHKLVLIALLRAALGLPQAIVVLAQSEAAAYRKFLPAARVEIIPNAIEIPAWGDTAPRSQSDAPLRVTYLGRLDRNKGIFEILEAVGVLRDRGMSLRLTIAGDGPDSGAIRAAVADAGFGGQVVFAGPVFGETKSRLWADSDVFAFPSHAEGLPYSLLESMAFGVVPVTTAVGAIPDVMQGGTHGFLIPMRNPVALADAIAKLDGDRITLNRMARSCQERIQENYTLKRMASEFRNLYRTL
jgi:glycosyltransferase involved in cell wall biosynthesis